MTGTLYLVPTPLGNLGDISRRQAETLAAVDFVAAEDTRVSIKLLNHLDIKKPLVSYHEHNKAGGGRRVLERLLAGENCALVGSSMAGLDSAPVSPVMNRDEYRRYIVLVRMKYTAGRNSFTAKSAEYAGVMDPNGNVLSQLR